MGKKKRPKARLPQTVAKTPRTVAPPSTQGDRPHFSFRYADRTSNESWVFKPDGEDASELFEFMCQMAELTWREIEGQRSGAHRKHHDQPIASIAPKARGYIAKQKLDETFGDTIFRFRLSGKKRLWGFRDGHVFYVVWWDAKHRVCPTEKH
jgi:hypothetical protein